MRHIEDHGTTDIRGEMAGGTGRDLYEFLVEAELQHYYTGFKNDLKVQNIPQLKYVVDEDLADMGMTKPEMRRLKKFFRKECPQGTFSKLKRMIVTSTAKENNGVSSQTSSGSVPSLPPASSPGIPRTGSRYIIQEEAISTLKTLGMGEFGTVQQGVWTTEAGERIQVAIKSLSSERMQAGRSDFLKEATVMHTIEHDHVVRLYGVVLGQDSLMLVTELAPLRSLLECLKDSSLRPSFPVARLCDFAVQICDGMSYLENKRLIHRDLAARNILVFAKDKVKISDFGLSRALGVGKDYYQTNFNVNLKLPIAWCAPECISYLKFTSASDVWAYGVTLWEMFTYGFQPWAGFTGQQILQAIDEPHCQRLEKPDCCPTQIYSLMLSCWTHNPEERPKFSELLVKISTLRPERLQAIKDCAWLEGEKDYLNYNVKDIITVLDNEPEDAPEEGLGRGVLDSGKVGYFCKTDTTQYIEVKTIASPMHRNKPTKLSRKESARRSQKIGSKKLDISMISGPANDLRHTGHIGCDGAVFGDVSFIDNTLIPLKSTSKSAAQSNNGSLTNSNASLPKSESDGEVLGSTTMFTREQSPRMIQSYTATSSATTRIEPSLTADVDTGVTSSDKYDDFDDLDTFKMPEMSMSDTFDLGFSGGSLLDDIMKSLTVTEPRGETSNNSDALSDDKSPLLERDPSFPNGKTSFDNIAMSANDTDSAGDRDSMNGGSGGFLANGSLRGSGSSSDMMESRGSSIELPTNGGGDNTLGKKKKKPSLKIDGEDQSEDDMEEFIPGSSRSTQRTGVRSLSESEEKQIDDAIALANAYASQGTNNQMSSLASPSPKSPSPKSQDSLSDHSHGGESDCNSSMNSLKLRSLLSKKKKKSPRQEKKTYTEEIANISDVSEEVTPEAQQAYNMLIVRGSLKEKDGDVVNRRREQRLARSREHERQTSPVPTPPERSPLSTNGTHSERSPLSATAGHTLGSAAVFTARSNRNANMHIREPQGIPRARMSNNYQDTNSAKEPEMDTNPLRRLRESSAIIPPRSFSARLPGDTKASKIGPKTAPKPILNANTSFFDKLKEQEQESSQESRQESSMDSCEGSEEGSTNSIPLPPRSARSSVSSNYKPRQRKYPLDLSQYNSHESSQPENRTSAFKPRALPPDPPSDGEEDLNSTRDSEDSVFSVSSQNSSSLDRQSRDNDMNSHRFNSSPVPQTTNSQFSVKSVKLTAKDLGYLDTSDLFWSKDVSLQEFGSCDQFDLTNGHTPIPGRYKTSDTVSYEDLLEFALDGVSERECDLDICDEVRLMRRVLTKDVTIEDCMYALEDTQWNVNSAIKLIKLKQLLSTRLAHMDRCKEVLLVCRWQVPEAADYLLRYSSGQESPELVHV